MGRWLCLPGAGKAPAAWAALPKRRSEPPVMLQTGKETEALRCTQEAGQGSGWWLCPKGPKRAPQIARGTQGVFLKTMTGSRINSLTDHGGC